MAVWQPREDGLSEICALLEQQISPSSAAVDKSQIWKQLQHFSQIPDFNNYLVFILVQAQGKSVEIRQAAGLLLKNNLKGGYSSMAQENRKYIKSELLPCLGAVDRHIRTTVGTIISEIVNIDGVSGWLELLPALVTCLDSNDLNHMDGAMDALSKICEDIPHVLDSEVPGLAETTPVNIFLPRLFQFFQSPHASLRKLSLGCVNQYVIIMPAALYNSMDKYLQGLFVLANDPVAEVRKLVCAAFVQLTEVLPSSIEPHLRNVMEYMLQVNKDPDEEVALEACEFWSAYCDAQLPPDNLKELLPRLIPVLLSNMAYADDDESLLDAEEDESQPDRDQDLKPRFHTSRLHGSEDFDNDDDDSFNVWNLRKCSAAAIDVLSNVFGDEILPALMPLIQAKISTSGDETWKEREAAVLTLGAIAEGCFNGLYPHLSEANDKFPLIRSISCWTLSRFGKYLIQETGNPKGYEQFEKVLMGLLRRLLDTNKRVQEAACSAFATAEEDAAEELVPHLGVILQHLMCAFGKYQRRNLRIVYDAIGTLADSVREELNKALGVGFAPFAQPVFQRCMDIIQLQQLAKVDPASAGAQYDREFIVCSLDLLSGLAEGLGSGIESLISQSNLRDVLLKCCMDETSDVRQSAFALMGDLARVFPAYLQPRLLEFLEIASQQLNANLSRENLSVANNACWAIGELAVKVRQEVSPIVTNVVSSLGLILHHGEAVNKSLVENSAITLGRLAWIRPDLVAPHMEHFMKPWCLALSMVRDDIEKEEAFRGLCAVVKVNPSGGVSSLVFICKAIASWHEIRNEDVKNEVSQVLNGYKHMLGNSWAECWSALEPPVRDTKCNNDCTPVTLKYEKDLIYLIHCKQQIDSLSLMSRWRF
ncbi:hypothetical protein IGI04_012478 [Brassica rapa subsp. trilocularis]|uniref:Importin N-terminal domain-containing protein n=1 Tax=Brassica rapa subsp. trilocularis TaxID=1813537 RepID=A0ABQ7N614_BRACM|nr:hypothetical protein IGI04_012478 [Brassica rapa subsp. trilocularis]